MAERKFRVLVFDLWRLGVDRQRYYLADAAGPVLGPWHQLEESVAGLLSLFVCSPRPRELKLFEVRGHQDQGLVFPGLHDLPWGQTPDDLPLLGHAQVESLLSQGRPFQAYIFNGDSDCLQHFLILPLADPVTRIPPRRMWQAGDDV
ncbi:MAG: hypothetical protein U0931_14320 [Vulcanimicrobiota bacterium]